MNIYPSCTWKNLGCFRICSWRNSRCRQIDYANVVRVKLCPNLNIVGSHYDWDDGRIAI